MRQPPTHPAHPALRQGLPAAVIIIVLWSVDAPVQAWRHTAGPSARWLVVFSFLFLLITALLLLRAGYRSARGTGRLHTALLAGAMAGAPGATLLTVVSNLQLLARKPPRDGIELATYVIALLLFVAAGALIGAVVTLPAAVVARSRYREEHAEELAALAAQRAAEREREREAKARRKRNEVPWPPTILAVVALFLVGIVPDLAAQWIYDTFPAWQALLLALVALSAGAALLATSSRVGWLGYVFDWLGVVCLCSGALLAIVELTGYVVGLLVLAAGFVYMWRLFNRVMRSDAPPPAERPERPPVAFRHDGESIVLYPSRRKLALHAAFAGGVVLVAGTLAFLLRGAGPVPVLGFGGFALLGLVGFIPDLTRLLVRWPALVVDSEGITDLASFGIIGFGLIPWHEIAGAFNAGTLRGGAFRELAIIPVSYRRLLSRQPLLKRPFLRLGSAFGGDMIFISSLYFSPSPSAVGSLINDYVKSHAPAGYIEPDEDESAEPDGQTDADVNDGDHEDQGNPEQDTR